MQNYNLFFTTYCIQRAILITAQTLLLAQLPANSVAQCSPDCIMQCAENYAVIANFSSQTDYTIAEMFTARG